MDKKNIMNPVVLIVDDNPADIHVLAEALRSECIIKTAASGQAALAIAHEEEQPAMILLDIMMPEMDGYEVCRRLKNDPVTKDIPVIFVTAKDESEDEAIGLNLGAADYISKPFFLPIVKARVRIQLSLKIKTELLQSLAHIDGLTHIPNRRSFDETFDAEWRRALRSKAGIAVCMMDIDHFKEYNDHYGHGAGDQCLKQVAQALASTVNRASDMIARYGGEEFVAIIADANHEGAKLIADRCRARIEQLNLPHAFSPTTGQVTISVGFASITASAHATQKDLLEAADKALYEAKKTGRNSVSGIML